MARFSVNAQREGGDPSSSPKWPGRSEYEAITLERGVTHDTESEKWDICAGAHDERRCRVAMR